MHCDSCLISGKGHPICQDYALCGEVSGNKFCLVSDGCSSSKDSDMGARFLAHAAKNTLSTFWDIEHEDYFRLTLGLAIQYAKSMGLDRTCLDATLLTMIETGIGVHVAQFGDGMIVRKKKDGDLVVFQTTFESRSEER